MKESKTEKVFQRDIKHEAIFNAAKKNFLSNGFKSTSMDEIANTANVSKRTVYQHFGNKEELFQAMLKEHWNRTFALDDQLFDDKRSIEYNLKNFSAVFLKFLYQQDTIDLFRLLIGEASQFPHLVDHILVGEKAPFTNALIVFLKEKKKNHELTIVNSDRAAAYFMGLLKEHHFWPMMLGFTKQKKPTNQEILITEAIDIFLKAYKVV